MTPGDPRRYIKLAAGLVIVIAALSAVFYIYSEYGVLGTTTPGPGTSSTTASCYTTNDLATSVHYAFTVAVNYTGQWNATAVGYSGENDSAAQTEYFADCFTGHGVGLIHFSDWNAAGQATLQVVAQKSDAGDGNMSMTMTYGSSNSLARTNSTVLPRGSAMVTGTMVGSTAVASTPTISTVSTSTAGTQLYDVTFQQFGDCSPPQYVIPWSVTLGNETISDQSNGALPIVFSVPDGVYQYTISPTGTFSSDYGSVSVNGAGVLVSVYGPSIGCTPTTTG